MTTDATATSKLWEDVAEGEQLPLFEQPMTPRMFLLAVVGMRDFNPVHHSTSYARSQTNNPDMWMNTMWHQGMVGRYVSDWAGPDADFRSSWLHMVGFIHPGDQLTIRGEVNRVFEEDGDHRAEIDVEFVTQRGTSARGGVVLAMPSKASGLPPLRYDLERPPAEPTEDTPDFARAWIGVQTDPLWAPYPVSEAQIMYWCEMAEDANPNYIHGAYSQASRHGGVIAPPMSLFTWIMGRPGHYGEPFERPDPDSELIKPWPPTREQEGLGPTSDRLITTLMAGDWQPPGTNRYAAQRVVQNYGRPYRPGDRVYSRSEVTSCAPRKATRLGEGHFITFRTSFYNDRDELTGLSEYTFFFYESADSAGTPTPHR